MPSDAPLTPHATALPVARAIALVREAFALGDGIDAALLRIERERESFAAEMEGTVPRALRWIHSCAAAHPLGLLEAELGLVQATRRLGADDHRVLGQTLAAEWPDPDPCKQRILRRITATAEVLSWRDRGGMDEPQCAVLIWLLTLRRPVLASRNVIPAALIGTAPGPLRTLRGVLFNVAPAFTELAGADLDTLATLLEAAP